METWEYKHYTYSASPRAGSPVAGAPAGGGLSPRCAARRAADVQSWCDTSHLSEPTDTQLGGQADDPESPGAFEYECFLSAGRNAQAVPPVIRHQGWLLKAYGQGPQRRWRRRWVYLTADRLCYTADPTLDGVRYIPLDRIPVRALPRGYGPKIGVAQLDASNPGLSPRKRVGCVFSVACGSHTHFLAAETPAAAKEWVDVISATWVQCVKHTARGTHLPSGEEVLAFREAHWKQETSKLRASLADVKAEAEAREGEYWQRWAAAEAKLKALEAAQSAPAAPPPAPSATYEIQVVTGDLRGAGTTSKVFLELYGNGAEGGSGEYRLMYKDAARPVFQRGTTDTFKLHCAELGQLTRVRVRHDNSGDSPGWFLAEVRVRRRRGEAHASEPWTTFACGRWLAGDQDDGRVMRDLACGPEAASAPAAVERLGAPVAASQPSWYQVVVCTSKLPDAGTTSEVWLALHGTAGSSARVTLPGQPGDFSQGREDVFRLALEGVGAPQRLSVGVGCHGTAPDWHLEQVEVTEEATGETVYFGCGKWLSREKARDGGTVERTLLGTAINPRRLAELEAQVKRLTAELEEAKAESAALTAEAQRLRSELADGAAGAASTGKSLTDSQAENTLLREQSEALAARAAKAEATAAAAEAELARVHGELSAVKQAERSAMAERARLEHSLEASRVEAANVKAEASSLRERLAAKAGELGRLQGEQAAMHAQTEELEGELEKARATLRALQKEHDSMARRGEGARKELEQEVERLAAELEKAQAKLAVLQREKVAAERAAGESTAREEELADRLRAAEAAAAAAAVAAAVVQPPAPSPPPPVAVPSPRQALEEAGPSPPPSPGKLADRLLRYSCRVWVKDVSGSLGPESLCLTLLGSKGNSGLQRLDISAAGGELRPATGQQVVACNFSAPDVGHMERLRLGLTASGGVPGSPVAATLPCSVLLSRVAVTCGATGENATFWCTPEAWLSSRDDFDYEYDASTAGGQPESSPGEGEAPGPCRYRIDVQTSNLKRAGTRGHVYLTILGDRGAAGPFMLSNAGGAHFGRGVLDAFALAAAPDVGTIRQVEVRHEARGRRDGWHLAWVKEGDPAVVGVASAVAPNAPSSKGIDAAVEAGEPEGPTSQPGYQIAFHTSRLCMSGTNARPFFELVGARGSSGIMQPLGTDRSFKPGRVDIFTYPQLPALGQLQALRVGTDGSGLFPAWLLNWVEVTHLPTAQRWVFGMGDWIGKSHKYVRWLDLEQTPEGPLPGKQSKWWSGAAAGGGLSGLPAATGGTIGAYHPPGAAVQLPTATARGMPAQQQLQQPPYQQGAYHQQGLSTQSLTPQRPWALPPGSPVVSGIGSAHSSPTRKTLQVGSPAAQGAALDSAAAGAGGLGSWGTMRPLRINSPAAASHNSILDVLAAPAGSPLATGGAARFSAAWG